MTKFPFGARATVLATVATSLVFASAYQSRAAEPIGSHAESSLAGEKACHSGALKMRQHGKSKESDWVKGRVTIKAPASTVWYSVHEERKNDPDLAYSKVLEQQSEHEATLEQKFVLIPMLGSSVCVTKQLEIPLKRIDYYLLRSDHFKAMEGSWVLTPHPDGKTTVLELNSHIDLGMPVPRWFLNATLSRKIERRLNHVKEMAEKMHAGVVAEKHTLPLKETNSVTNFQSQ
jgi:hypothetical protein